MANKIVFVNQDAGYMTIDLANAFADKYDEVVLLAGIIVRMHSELNPKVRIRRLKSYNRKNIITRAISWIISTFQVLFFLKVHYRKHELYISSNPPTLIFLLLFLKRKFSLIIWDLYPDALIMGKFLNPKNPVISLWARVNRRVFPDAASIVTLTNGMAKSLNKYVNGNSVHIIPAWASGSPVSESDNELNPFIQKHNLSGKFIILYSGNLGKEHELETLVKLAEKLKDNQSIMIVIAGRGWKYNMLNKEITDKGLSNCILLSKQSVELFQASLSAANIGVVSLTQSAAGVSIPSKTYNLLAAGKPILCIGGETSDLAELLRDSVTGAAFGPDKLDMMYSFVLLLHQNPEIYLKYCRNAFETSKRFTSSNSQEIVKIHQNILVDNNF